ncbi:hypothetical protein H2O64_15310 [Kordia sp. YSTF-M3]|uniref:Prepilin type IV endopeptidase peptidase domain-containing protein n=1 Tax=Kordia aestuariivivens TaxID=2759037 RepID=A0ABR7QBV0_9FLAO|nr:hypothetical protein [Kordia aestuariivivens]MBC8756045.1 hypothetical protein [Kordia aestuariivivens]
MKTLVTIILVLVFAVIIFQDFKYRAIHAITIIGIGIVATILNYLEPTLTFFDMLQSISFLIITSIAFMIYQTIKQKTFQNPIDQSIGLGDLLFFIVITPLFQVHQYILFFIVGLLISAGLFMISKSILKEQTIPLAGYLSFLLIICFGLKILNIVNPFFIEF